MRSSNVGPAVPASQPRLDLGFILSSEAEDLPVACLPVSIYPWSGPMHTHQSHQLPPPVLRDGRVIKILDKLFSESLGKSLATPTSAPPPPFHGIHSITTALFSPLSIKGDLSSLLNLQPSGSETLIFEIQEEQSTGISGISNPKGKNLAIILGLMWLKIGSASERLFF
jgi:hypothetical protein